MIACIGNLVIDDIVRYHTREVFPDQSGGNALFASIGARIWADDVTLLARIGKTFPTQNLRQMADAGIDVNVRKMPYPDIHAWTLYEPDGGRQFINHLSSGTHYQLSITGADLPPDIMHAAGFHLAPMPTDVQAGQMSAIRQASDARITWDPHIEYLTKDRFHDLAWTLLPKVDAFLPSREEADLLLGRDDPQAAAGAFIEAGAPLVVIKLGADGAMLMQADTPGYVHIPRVDVPLIDQTGAGDSFCGGFLAGWVATDDPIAAACHGTVSASYAISVMGAVNTLSLDRSDRDNRLAAVLDGVTRSG